MTAIVPFKTHLIQSISKEFLRPGRLKKALYLRINNITSHRNKHTVEQNELKLTYWSFAEITNFFKMFITKLKFATTLTVRVSIKILRLIILYTNLQNSKDKHNSLNE